MLERYVYSGKLETNTMGSLERYSRVNFEHMIIVFGLLNFNVGNFSTFAYTYFYVEKWHLRVRFSCYQECYSV